MLSRRPFAVVATKIDISGASERLSQLQAYCKRRKYRCFPVSSATREGLDSLITFVGKKVDSLRQTPMRDEILARAKRIVVKIGSSLIASRATGLRPEQIERLADEIAALRTSGGEILVVSSGAIISGIKKLELKEYPKNLPVKQAAAAVGQSRLMWAYEKAFERMESAGDGV